MLLGFALLIFLIGSYGMVFSRKHLIIILISLELLILAINIILISYSVLYNDVLGQLSALLILGMAAGESALGLSIIIAYYRLRGSININVLNLLKV